MHDSQAQPLQHIQTDPADARQTVLACRRFCTCVKSGLVPAGDIDHCRQTLDEAFTANHSAPGTCQQRLLLTAHQRLHNPHRASMASVCCHRLLLALLHHQSPNNRSQHVSMIQHAAQQAKIPAQQAQQGPPAPAGWACCCDITIWPGA